MRGETRREKAKEREEGKERRSGWEIKKWREGRR